MNDFIVFSIASLGFVGGGLQFLFSPSGCVFHAILQGGVGIVRYFGNRSR